MDLNEMMRQSALDGLNAQLDTAVADGDAAKAREITKKISDFNVALVPKTTAPAGVSEADIKTELAALPWFGVDPKKSAKAMEFARNMAASKFPTAKAYVEAVVKAMEDDAAPAPAADADDGNTDDDEDDDTGKKEAKPAARRTDGPRSDDLSNRRGNAGSGAWSKLSDAPKEVQERIRASADKFVPSGAKDEVRKQFISNALSAAYSDHQRKTGKK